MQVVFDHDRSPGRSETAAEHEVDRPFGFSPSIGDHDTFAGREPVGLDHDGKRNRSEMPLGGVGLVEPPVTRRGNGAIAGQFLGEPLRALQLRGSPGGAEDRDPGGVQRIGDAGHERRLRTHHDEIDAVAPREGDDGRGIVRVDRHIHTQRRGPRIARCHEEPAELRARRDRGGQRVFASPGTEEKDIHRLGQVLDPVARPRVAPQPGL